MAEFKHVKRIMVSLWGHRVGTIVSFGTRDESYAFQYDRKFLKSGIEISPLMMPLRKEPYAFVDLPRSEYSGLPPAFADSLPVLTLSSSRQVPSAFLLVFDKP